MKKIIKLIKENLTPDLLKPEWRRRVKPTDSPMKGHCYVASECLYHLTDKKLQPKVISLDRFDGDKLETITHWWLEDNKGNIYDLTAEQFPNSIPYNYGRKAAFLTKTPSKRCRILMERIKHGTPPQPD